MNGECGQCYNGYRESCQYQSACLIHQGKCFACRNCKEMESWDRMQPAYCCICRRLCSIHDFYHDKSCAKDICRRQFKNTVFLGKVFMTLPCGCEGKQEDVLQFVSQYCITCSRKLSIESPFQLKQCELCEAKTSRPKVQTKLEAKQIQKIQDFQSQMIEKPHKVDNIFENKEIMLLSDRIERKKLEYRISQLARIELKKNILRKQKALFCPTCLLPFDTKFAKPYMVCLKQHSMCEKCIKQKKHITLCIHCKDVPIDRSKVFINRQFIRILQFEELISQKFQKKKRKMMNIKKQEAIIYRNGSLMKAVQVQTTFPEENIKKKEELQRKDFISVLQQMCYQSSELRPVKKLKPTLKKAATQPLQIPAKAKEAILKRNPVKQTTKNKKK